MRYFLGVASMVLFVVCIVHAIRTGRVFPWIFILIFLPGLGPLIYLFVELVPEIVSARQAGRMKRGLTKIASPNRDFHAAKREVDLVGSADAKRKLAEEHFVRGQYGEAMDLYRSALAGAHSDDPALLFGLARAQFAAGDGADALASLDALQAANPKFASTDVRLLTARALELQGKDDDALAQYANLVRHFAGEEARCRYALLLQKTGASDKAREVFSEILKLTDGAPGHYRRAQREWRDLAKRNLTG